MTDADQRYKSDFFKVPLLWLKWAGIPIKPLKMNAFAKYFYLAYCGIVLTICPFAYTFGEVFEGTRLVHADFDRFTFNLAYSVTHTLGFVKVFIFTTKRRQIWRICQKFESGKMAPDVKRGGDVEFKYVKDAIRLVNFQGYFFNGVVFILLSLRAINTALEKIDYDYEMQHLNPNSSYVPILPKAFLSYFPFSIEKSPVYEIAVSYQIFAAWVYGIYVGAIDTVITGYLIHIKAQFLILKNSIDTFVQKAEEECMAKSGLGKDEINKLIQSYRDNKSPTTQNALPPQIQKYATAIVKDCVRHHLEIIKVSEEVEDEFSILILLQYLTSIFMICFNLFQLYITDIKSYRYHSTVFYLLVMLFQLFIYCGNGNEVIMHSGGVSDAVFQSSWILADESCKKELLLIMMRAQRPIKFTAAKFAFLSLETFTLVLKAGASYFMFLRKTVDLEALNRKRFGNQ